MVRRRSPPSRPPPRRTSGDDRPRKSARRRASAAESSVYHGSRLCETPAEIADAEAQVARLAAQFPNVAQTDLLHLRNARSIVGAYKEAADIAEPLVKLRTLAQLARPARRSRRTSISSSRASAGNLACHRGAYERSAGAGQRPPSPGAAETNRHLNRLVFGEDTAEGALDIIKRKFGWPGGGSARFCPVPLGRDVRSPSVGPYAYHPAQSAPPQAVSVSGQAQVDHTIHLDVMLDPALRAKIDQILNALQFTVPMIGDGAGRMDSDGGSHRTGGIGHQ
jgi:hypothetical protein